MMNTINVQIENLNSLLLSVADSLDSLTFESFDTVFPRTVNAMKQVHELKGKMLEEYGYSQLKQYEKELLPKAKQIEEKFDNIVKVFSREEKRLEKELSTTLQRKKLTLYKR